LLDCPLKLREPPRICKCAEPNALPRIPTRSFRLTQALWVFSPDRASPCRCPGPRRLRSPACARHLAVARLRFPSSPMASCSGRWKRPRSKGACGNRAGKQVAASPGKKRSIELGRRERGPASQWERLASRDWLHTAVTLVRLGRVQHTERVSPV
jgi:hypothetical protein